MKPDPPCTFRNVVYLVGSSSLSRSPGSIFLTRFFLFVYFFKVSLFLLAILEIFCMTSHMTQPVQHISSCLQPADNFTFSNSSGFLKCSAYSVYCRIKPSVDIPWEIKRKIPSSQLASYIFDEHKGDESIIQYLRDFTGMILERSC